MRIGNATTNRHLFAIGEKPSPFCDHCPGTKDQVEHRMFDCHAYNTLRAPLLELLSHYKVSPTLRTLLNPERIPPAGQIPMLLALGLFLEASGLDNLFVWNPCFHKAQRTINLA